MELSRDGLVNQALSRMRLGKRDKAAIAATLSHSGLSALHFLAL